MQPRNIWLLTSIIPHIEAMQEPCRFVIKACLTTDRNGKTSEERFEFTHLVSHVRDTGAGAYFYDPNLKINVEDNSKLTSVFQIDIENIYLNLSPKLRKASDFIRRVNYINDWIEVTVNSKGIVKSIENLKELRTNWPMLRRRIEMDYEGMSVVRYLNEKEIALNSTEGILPCIYTYLCFGMMFPHIPAKHAEDWRNSRQIFFSEYENEAVEEKLSYVGLYEDKRRYDVSLSNPKVGEIKFVKGRGYYLVPPRNIFPESAKIQIEYRNDTMTNNWSFRLEKY